MGKVTCFMGNKCAFTGHRNIKEDFSEEKLEKSVLYLIENRNVDTFLCGMARGFDLIAGQLIIKLKGKYPYLKLIACVPCRGQESLFSSQAAKLYSDTLKGCDEVKVLSERYYNGCMQARDRYMVDNADVVLGYLNEGSGGTYYTVSYAEQKGKELYII